MSKAFTREDASEPPAVPTPRRSSKSRPMTAEGRVRFEAELARLQAQPSDGKTLSQPESSMLHAQRERRIQAISAILDETYVQEPASDPEGRVRFGAHVQVEDEDGLLLSYHLVGPDEADARNGRLSVESPLARALLGRSVGDFVTVERPRGSAEYRVVQVDAPPA